MRRDFKNSYRDSAVLFTIAVCGILVTVGVLAIINNI